MSRATMNTIVGSLTLGMALLVSTFAETAESQPHPPYRILHINSYHLGFTWTANQFKGFSDALKDLPVDYRVFEMDTKRNSSEHWQARMSAEARALIESWQPDLVYANDDSAQKHVVQHYIDTELPFVFSGVNADPSEYGFVGSSNITGVLEREHSLETLRLLRRLAPEVRTIAVLLDQGPTWPGVVAKMKEALINLPEVEVVAWKTIHTFDEYKRTVLSLQDSVDAIAPLGIFNYADGTGNNVPHELVLRWTFENSRLPDFSFWRSRVERGTLCAVTVSGYAQGNVAGKLARQILVEGKAPSALPITSTRRSKPLVSLPKIRQLNLKLDSSILLTAEALTEIHDQ